MSGLRIAALEYAARGWPVFPLTPRDKIPMISREEGGQGFRDATTDARQIEEWWTRRPEANIGFWPGPAGIVVVDQDGPDAAGVATALGLFAEPTPTVDLIAMLVNYLEPQVVVEAGTYYGHVSFTIANMLRAVNKGGKVYTADPENRITKTLESTEFDPIRPFLVYHEGDFLDMLGRVPDPIEFAFIDASSTTNPAMRREHFEAVWDRLAPGALALIHDTSGKWGDAPWFRELASLHLPQHRGLTIIQKDL